MEMQSIDFSDIKAAIFDMDGTMVDNMSYHQKAWEEFYKQHNMPFSEETFRTQFAGKNNKQVFHMLFGEHISDEKVNKPADEKERIYRELYANEISPIPGLIEFLEQLKQKGIKLAVATTAIKENRELVLNALEIHTMFDAIIGYEDVVKGKPDPEIFLKAAAKLDVDPEQCTVFDDAPSGIEAAKRAGMKTVGLLTSHSKEELNADVVIRNFQALMIFPLPEATGIDPSACGREDYAVEVRGKD